MRLLPLLPLLLAACEIPTGGTDADLGPPTFTRVRNEVIAPSCAFSICHGGATGYLELHGSPDDHARLVGVDAFGKEGATLVVPGDADASYVVQKLEGRDGIEGDPMPAGGGLDDERLALVRAWIEAGAKDD